MLTKTRKKAIGDVRGRVGKECDGERRDVSHQRGSADGVKCAIDIVCARRGSVLQRHASLSLAVY